MIETARDRSGLAKSESEYRKERASLIRGLLEIARSQRSGAARQRAKRGRIVGALYPEGEKERAQMSHVRRDVLEANFIIQGERVHSVYRLLSAAKAGYRRAREREVGEGGGRESVDIERPFPRADFAPIRLGLHSRSP